MKKKLTIYSTPTCYYCNIAKDYFEKHNIEYNCIDVKSSLTDRQKMITLSGQMGVPVIVYKKEVMLGWDEDKFKKLIKQDENKTTNK